jgi:hypothetical protein
MATHVAEAGVAGTVAPATGGDPGIATAAAVADDGAAGLRPYAPGWVDRITEALERLPGPTGLAYLAVAGVLVAVSLTTPVVSTGFATDALATQVFWGMAPAALLWLAHDLSGVAGTALDTFRPALTATDAEVRDLRYRLTVTPARGSAVILVLSAITTPLYYVLDPVGSSIVGLSPAGLVLRYVNEVFFGALLIVILYQSLRQLRLVSRVHAGATRVDLFRPAPLYAFSVLTSRTAMVLALAFTVPTLVAAAQAPTTSMAFLIAPWVLIGIAGAAIVFVVPLRGMQQRIVAEKRRLQSEVGLRIERTVDVIHVRLDGGDLAGAGSMKGALDVLLTERDLIEKLPTLPWRPGTLGGLVTAIGLPIALFVATRLIERML